MTKIPPFATLVILAVAATLGTAAPAAGMPQDSAAYSGLLDLDRLALHAAAHSDPHGARAGMLLRGSPALLALVHELERTSPSAAFMLRTLRQRGVPVTFGTFEEMAFAVRSAFHSYDPGRSRALGYMAPRVRADARSGAIATDEIMVALNLTRLDELFADARVREATGTVEWSRIQRLETLALLGHEIAHAYGLVVSGGDPRGGCPDPRRDESPETSCVVIAENLVRRELGAPLDWGYGLAAAEALLSRYDALSRRHDALRAIEAQSVLWSRAVAPRLAFVPQERPPTSETP